MNLDQAISKVTDKDPLIPIAEVYSRVLDFFKDKSRFAQGYYQYDREGNKSPWREGYSYCVLGACLVFSEGFSHRAQCCLQRVSEHLYDGKTIQEVNDQDDGYDKVLKALEFARDLWLNHEPTDKDLGTSVKLLLEKRNEHAINQL